MQIFAFLFHVKHKGTKAGRLFHVKQPPRSLYQYHAVQRRQCQVRFPVDGQKSLPGHRVLRGGRVPGQRQVCRRVPGVQRRYRALASALTLDGQSAASGQQIAQGARAQALPRSPQLSQSAEEVRQRRVLAAPGEGAPVQRILEPCTPASSP